MRREMWSAYERQWLRKQATQRRYERIFKDNGGIDHHASVVADLLVESGEFPSRQQALRHLLMTARGAAHLQRLRTSKKGTPDMVDTSAVKISKGIADSGKSWLSEHELTEKIFAFAQHDRRAGESEQQAFARHFNAGDAQGLVFRKAVQIARTGTYHPFPR